MTSSVDISTLNTDDAILDFIEEWFCTRHRDIEGGYPYGSRWFDDQLAVASLSHKGETEIDVYERGDLLAWFHRAQRLLEEHEDLSTEDALFETETEVFDANNG